MNGTIFKWRREDEIRCPQCNSRLVEEEDHAMHVGTAVCYSSLYHCFQCEWKGSFHLHLIDFEDPVSID